MILRDGEVAACDTLAGLREKTECRGPLSEVLERLIHPQTLDNIENYFRQAPP